MLILGDDYFEGIRDNTLKTIGIDYQVDITPDDLTRLVLCILAENTSVDTFLFGDCELNDSHIEALVTALVKDGRTVEIVDVTDNYNITDRGLLMLLSAKNIKAIGCARNNITDRVVPAILARECDRRVYLSTGSHVSRDSLEKIKKHFKRQSKNESNQSNEDRPVDEKPEEIEKEQLSNCHRPGF